MKEPNLELAKKRIWKRMESKLPERGLHSAVLQTLRTSQQPVRISRLKRVQAKERLLDLLPERVPAPAFRLMPSKWWSLGTLGMLMGTLFVPLMDLAPVASASSQNRLEVVEGDVFVNGVLVEGQTILQIGDSIMTSDGSMAHLIFLDDSRMTLGPSSQVDIVDSWMDPENRANTRIVVEQSMGRAWTQVLNLVSKDASFVLQFPQGQLTATQRASFDVEVNEAESRVEVARSLVDIAVDLPEESYAGILGQDAVLTVSDEIASSTVLDSEKEDVWWTFNLAYGKSYSRTLDENYQQENVSLALILPGNPLYGLKTFREDLQVSLAFTSEAKQDLLIQQAESRLNEAQILLARGETDKATEVLEDYQDTVLAASLTGGSGNEELLAQFDETQKQVFADPTASEADALLQEHLSTTSKLLTEDLFEQNAFSLQSASQQLQQVPDLVADGLYEEAILALENYQSSSLSLLVDLENVDMEKREELVSSLLEQKLADVQLLRVIASMPELYGSVDLSGTVLEQLSLLALSLREKELGDLSAFFELNEYDELVQQDLYDRIKNGAPMTEELADQFTSLEEEMSSSETVVIDLEPVEQEVLDPRFSVPHTDETQD